MRRPGRVGDMDRGGMLVTLNLDDQDEYLSMFKLGTVLLRI